MSSEFLIIGGGVIGLSVARKLREYGGDVALLDRERCGGEASWAAAGMLAPNCETHEDGPFFRFCTASNAIYPEFAAQLFEETGIDVELDRAGTLFLSFERDDESEIRDKYRWQKAAGIDVEVLSRQEVRDREPKVSENVRSALFYPNDWQVENRKLVAALKRSCEIRGVRILERTNVNGLVFKEDRITGVKTGDGELGAHTVVIASGAWASELLGADVVRPIRGQMICLARGRKDIRSVVYSHRGYVVPRADGRVLVGATVEDVGFNKAVLPESIVSLREAALEIAPSLGIFDVSEAWAGLRPYASDGLPIIGPVPGREGLFAASGHYRNGILLAPITAEVVADALLGHEASEFLSVFGPGRFASASSGTTV